MKQHFLKKHLFTDLFTVNGTDVWLRVNFREYPKERFLLDLEIAKHVNMGTWGRYAKNENGDWSLENVPPTFKRRLEWRCEYDITAHADVAQAMRRGTNPKLTYEEFRKVTANLLAKHVEYLLAHKSASMLAGKKEFTLIFEVMDREDTYWEVDVKDATLTRLVARIRGATLVGRFYMPFAYTGRADAAFILKSATHDFQHYNEAMRGLYRREFAVQDKVTRFLELHPNDWFAGVTVLYEILSNLYTEGFATFKERSGSTGTLYDLGQIERHLEQLTRIASSETPEEGEEIYENEFQPNSHTGEYYLGHLMCFTIGLRYELEKSRWKRVHLLKPEDVQVPVSELDAYLTRHRSVVIAQLSPEAYRRTLDELSRVTYYKEFLRIYFDACRTLGLKDAGIFTEESVRTLRASATKTGERRVKKERRE